MLHRVAPVFAEITERRIRRGVHTRVRQLAETIEKRMVPEVRAVRSASSARVQRTERVAGKRKRDGASFKAPVALEALRGEATIAERVVKHGVHQTPINAWKRQAIEGTVEVFSGKAEAVAAERGGELDAPRSTAPPRPQGVRWGGPRSAAVGPFTSASPSSTTVSSTRHVQSSFARSCTRRSASPWWSGMFGEGLRTISVARRREMVEPAHPTLSVIRRCALVGIGRSRF